MKMVFDHRIITNLLCADFYVPEICGSELIWYPSHSLQSLYKTHDFRLPQVGILRVYF